MANHSSHGEQVGESVLMPMGRQVRKKDNTCMRTVQQYQDSVESVRSLHTLPLGQCNTHEDNAKFV